MINDLMLLTDRLLDVLDVGGLWNAIVATVVIDRHTRSNSTDARPDPHPVRERWTFPMTHSPDRRARMMLPIPDRPAPGLTTFDAKDPDTAFPPIEPLLPPEGAPNVLIVLIDDVGFGASSAFGGPCNTPTAGTTVTPDYTAHGSRFAGKIHWVQLDVGVDDHDHFIDPEERFRIAMARQ